MQRKLSKRKTINKLVLIVNLFAAIGLLISQLSCYVSPAACWPAEMIALSYPFLLMINILFVFYWLIQLNRNAFISFIIILVGLRQLSQAYQLKFHSPEKQKIIPGSFSVMSYNVRLFDLYNWTGNLKTRARIFSFLQSENPDILCFQEYYTSDDPVYHFENTIALSNTLAASNYHVEYGINMQKTQHFGLATFTRYPIIHKGKVLYEKGRSNFGMYSDLLINKDTVRIYNVHLQSNHFREEEYRFIEAPDSGTKEQILQSSKNVLKLLKKAAIIRADQVNTLKAEIGHSPYPVILCGDFNDPPFSYAYTSLSDNLKDAFQEEGSGTGITLSGTVPFYRIDYILHNPLLKCHDFNVIPIKLSDHLPVKAKFSMVKE